MTTAQDIRTEMVLKAPRAKVWKALTTPEGWMGWFSEAVESTFQVGELIAMTFDPDIKCFGIVVEREELSRFAYKWHPGEDCPIDKYPESEMTTVTFQLQDHEGGTKLTMHETGFENLPEDRRPMALRNNNTGWTWELGELQAYVEHDERQMLANNEIVRERVYRTTPENLWRLVATPEGLKSWFVKDIRGEFKLGEIPLMVFEVEGKEFSGPFRITELKEPEVFAFRSHPGQESGCTWDQFPEEEATTTTFTITPVEGGAKLKVEESGFDRVPKERRTNAHIGNSRGWSAVMDMLEGAID